MDILLLDSDQERRRRLLEAIDLLGCVRSIRLCGTLAETRTMARHGSFTVALVGPEVPEHSLAAITFLRGLLPSTLLIAYDSFDRYDASKQQRILDAGANAVFDVRFSAMKIAMLLRPLLQGSVDEMESPVQSVAA
jgi:hypothetical protein